MIREVSPAEWPYTIRAYRDDQLVCHTRHRDTASRDREIAAYRVRIARGEIASIEVVERASGLTVTIGR